MIPSSELYGIHEKWIKGNRGELRTYIDWEWGGGRRTNIVSWLIQDADNQERYCSETMRGGSRLKVENGWFWRMVRRAIETLVRTGTDR
jgi:hypothetical protein